MTCRGLCPASALDAAGGRTTIDYSTPDDGATRVTDQRSKQTTYYFVRQRNDTSERQWANR